MAVGERAASRDWLFGGSFQMSRNLIGLNPQQALALILQKEPRCLLAGRTAVLLMGSAHRIAS